MSTLPLIILFGAGAIVIPVCVYALRELDYHEATRYWASAWILSYLTAVFITLENLGYAPTGLRELCGSIFSVLLLCGTMAYLKRPAQPLLWLAVVVSVLQLGFLLQGGPNAARWFGGVVHSSIVAGTGLLLLTTRLEAIPLAGKCLAVSFIGIALSQLLQPFDSLYPALNTLRLAAMIVFSISAGIFQLLLAINQLQGHERQLQTASEAVRALTNATEQGNGVHAALDDIASGTTNNGLYSAFEAWFESAGELTRIESETTKEHYLPAVLSLQDSGVAWAMSLPRPQFLGTQDLAGNALWEQIPPPDRKNLIVAPISYQETPVGLLLAQTDNNNSPDTTLQFTADFAQVLGLRWATTNLRETLRPELGMATVAAVAGGVAHDFNNQLTMILGQTELLQDDLPLDHQLQEQLSDLEKNVLLCADLSRELLSLTPQNSARTSLNLADSLATAVRLVRPSVPRSISITIADTSSAPSVLCSASDLHRVLVNLILNARDALEGQGEINVSAKPILETGSGNRVVEISVEDTGCGMDEQTKARVFEPLFSTKRSGSGLGLLSSRNLVEQYGGSITIDSAVSAGTVCRVKLPAA